MELINDRQRSLLLNLFDFPPVSREKSMGNRAQRQPITMGDFEWVGVAYHRRSHS